MGTTIDGQGRTLCVAMYMNLKLTMTLLQPLILLLQLVRPPPPHYYKLSRSPQKTYTSGPSLTLEPVATSSPQRRQLPILHPQMHPSAPNSRMATLSALHIPADLNSTPCRNEQDWHTYYRICPPTPWSPLSHYAMPDVKSHSTKLDAA